MLDQIIPYFKIVKFQASALCHFAKLFFLFDASKTATTQIRSNASCAASAEGVKHPVVHIGRCQDKSCQKAQWLLGRMFAT